MNKRVHDKLQCITDNLEVLKKRRKTETCVVPQRFVSFPVQGNLSCTRFC